MFLEGLHGSGGKRLVGDTACAAIMDHQGVRRVVSGLKEAAAEQTPEHRLPMN